MKTVEIKWQHIDQNQISGLKGATDYGLYILYGNHRIYGKDVLLYVGKARDQSFGERIPQHVDWFDWIEINPTYLIGRLGGENQINNKDWGELIDYAESRIIQYCQPAWNSSGLNSFKKDFTFGDAAILNHGFHRNLPLVIADFLISTSEYSKKLWKPYSNGR